MNQTVCLVVSSEMTVTAFLLEPIRALGKGYPLKIVLNAANIGHAARHNIHADVIPVRIERPISPWHDVRALGLLWAMFRRERFQIVHSVTPKAGLLAMIAARMAGTPIRVHTFTGQVWATRQGFSRWLLKTMDRILASCATHLLADSPSQRQFIIDQGIVGANKILVLAHGSISGVNTEKFAPDTAARATVRRELRIPEGAVVFLYLGRMSYDKGVLDLAHAFARLAVDHQQAHLLVVGPDEENLEQSLFQICVSCVERVHRVGYTDAPQRYMAAADVFCLPSYREGFGTVIIEAAAVGLPAIGSRIYGVTDAIVEHETGLLFPPGEVDALVTAMIVLTTDAPLRKRLGMQARARAIREFSSEVVVKAWLDFYARLQ